MASSGDKEPIYLVSERLKFFKSQPIGHGSEGTAVFVGLFEDRIQVAVKRMVNAHFTNTNEVEILSTNNTHENIVRYYWTEKNNFFMYLVMELCAGSLVDLVVGTYKGPKLGSKNEVLLQITLGIEYLHNKNFIHRDLNPQKVLISKPDGTVPPKIKLAHSSESKVGTVGWSAPEIFKPDVTRYSSSADIFSLGCVFGYVLTDGHHPFGDGRMRIANILNDKLDWKGEQRILDEDFKQLIKKMIALDPKTRPEIEKILRHRFLNPPYQASPLPSADVDLPTEIISDKLQVIKNQQLGRGADGSVVYEGLFEGVVRIAVKRMINDNVTNNEAEMLCSNSNAHENIVRYYGSEKNNNFTFLVMELCAGTLDDLVSGKYNGPRVDSKTEVLRQIASGVEYLHSNYIVHRDIKPGNILISIPDDTTVPPRMKLADFGLIKHKTRDLMTQTSIVGIWSAPEMFDPNETMRFNSSVDIFSLGCVFGYVLTGGHHPFGDGTMHLANILFGKLDWKEEQKIVNMELKQLIHVMISRDPNKRPNVRLILQLLDLIRTRVICKSAYRGKNLGYPMKLSSSLSSLNDFQGRVNDFFFTQSVFDNKSIFLDDSTHLLLEDGIWFVNSGAETDTGKCEYLFATSRSVFSSDVGETSPSQSVLQEFGLNVTCMLQVGDELILIGNINGDVSLFCISADAYSESQWRAREIVLQDTIEFGCGAMILNLQASPEERNFSDCSQVKVIVTCYSHVLFVLIERVRSSSGIMKYSLRLERAIKVDFDADSMFKPNIRCLKSTTWFGQHFVLLHYDRNSEESEICLYEWISSVKDYGSPILMMSAQPRDFIKLSCSPRSYQNRWLLACFNISKKIIEVWSAPAAEGEKCAKIVSFLKHSGDCSSLSGTAPGESLSLSNGTISWLPSENFTLELEIPIIASWGCTMSGCSSIIFIWNAITGEVLHELTLDGYPDVFKGISFAPEGNLFATTMYYLPNNDEEHQQKVMIWSYKKRTNGELHALPEEIILQLSNDNYKLLRFSWHPNGKTLAVVNYTAEPDQHNKEIRLTFWKHSSLIWHMNSRVQLHSR